MVQAKHGLGGQTWKPHWTYEYVLGQIGLIFPTVLIWAVRGTRKAPVWLWLLAWGPLGFFLLTTSKNYAEANWPIVAYAAIFALAVLAPQSRSIWYRITLATWAVTMIGALFLITTRWTPTGHPIKSKEFFEFDGLRTVASQHEPLFARSYQMASKLSFDLKKPIYKLKDMNRVDFYDFLPESKPSGDHFYVLAEKDDPLPRPLAAEGFHIVTKTPVADEPTFVLWDVRK